MNHMQNEHRQTRSGSAAGLIVLVGAFYAAVLIVAAIWHFAK